MSHVLPTTTVPIPAQPLDPRDHTGCNKGPLSSNWWGQQEGPRPQATGTTLGSTELTAVFKLVYINFRNVMVFFTCQFLPHQDSRRDSLWRLSDAHLWLTLITSVGIEANSS